MNGRIKPRGAKSAPGFVASKEPMLILMNSVFIYSQRGDGVIYEIFMKNMKFFVKRNEDLNELINFSTLTAAIKMVNVWASPKKY